MPTAVRAVVRPRRSFLLPFTGLLLVAASLPAQIEALTLEPRGAHATLGTASVAQDGSRYLFRYDGGTADESLLYAIDMTDAEVQAGMVRVHELTTGAIPIANGGLAWRTGPGTLQIETPRYHATQVTAGSVELYHEQLDTATRTLTLKYHEVRGGIAAAKTYEFHLVGKVLRVRAYGDLAVNDRFVGNYARFEPGQAVFPSQPVEQQIPFMDSAIVVGFDAGGQQAWCSTMLDWYRVNGCAANHAIPHPLMQPPPPPPPPLTFERFYPSLSMRSDALQTSPWQLLANVDDTMNLIVTRHLREAFLVPPSYRSPYYLLTSGRMALWGTGIQIGAWNDYTRLYDRLQQLGLTDLAILQYGTRAAGSDILTPFSGHALAMGLSSAQLIGLSPGTQAIPQVPGQQPGTAGTAYAIDPQAPAVVASADAAFVNLAVSARSTGAVFSSTVVHNMHDQWGTGPYPQSLNTLAATPSYPTQYPYVRSQWGSAGNWFGLKLPAANSLYVPSRSVFDWTGATAPGWDTGNNLNPPAPASGAPLPNATTSWHGYGYRMARVDALYEKDLMADQYGYGKQNFFANASEWDASHVLPLEFYLDATSSATKTHTAGDYLRRHDRAVREIRQEVEGPMYSEASHRRWEQAYGHGAYDGFRQGFPTADTNPPQWNIHASWVIPDYNLVEVLAKAGGHAGMDREDQYWKTDPALGIAPPYDGQDGDRAIFFDSYVVRAATFGNNPFASTNGDVSNNYWTYQGILRQYALLAGLARRMRESGAPEVRYFDPANPTQAFTLDEALASGLDLKQPFVRVTFANGLVFYGNLDVDEFGVPGQKWQVQVAKTNGQLETLDLSPNGFAAGDGAELFVFLNAAPAGTPTAFDYVKYEGRWEMINNRAADDPNSTAGIGYDGFPSSAVIAAFSPADWNRFAEGLVMEDKRLNQAVGAAGGLWNQNLGLWLVNSGEPIAAPLGSPPVLTSIRVETEATQLRTDKPEGFVAIGEFTRGPQLVAWEDITTLCSWSVSGPATVDASGAVTATAPGAVTVTATYTPGQQPFHTLNAAGTVAGSSPAVPAIAGAPSVTDIQDAVVPAGRSTVFDASSSVDPKGGRLRHEWTFGDGATAEGPVVRHAFREPLTAPYAAQLRVTDVEANESIDTFQITADWFDSTYWADAFDDGLVHGWLQPSGSLFGVRGGRAATPRSAGAQLLTIDGVNHQWDQVSAGAEVYLGAPGTGSNEVGLNVRKAAPGDLPAASGFRAAIDLTGKVLVAEANGTQLTGGPVMDLTRGHDLRLVTRRVTSTTHEVRAYVDGELAVSLTGSAVPAGYAGVYTQDWSAAFDDYRLTSPDAPYVTATPLELDGDAATDLSFYLDDQNTYANLRLSQLKFTIRDEQDATGANVLTWSSFASFASILTTGTPTFENGPNSQSTSTWGKVTLAQTVEQYMENWGTDTVSFELVVPDRDGNYGRKYVCFRR